MTRVEIDEAKASLSEYTRKAGRGDVVVTRRGRPVALLRVLTDQEWEDYAVGHSPVFRRLLEKSNASYRRHGGIPLAQIEKEFGLPARRHARRRVRSGAGTRGSR
jgi:prevent-host-death family protein